MYCKYCGNEIPQNETYCLICGEKADVETNCASKRSVIKEEKSINPYMQIDSTVSKSKEKVSFIVWFSHNWKRVFLKSRGDDTKHHLAWISLNGMFLLVIVLLLVFTVKGYRFLGSNISKKATAIEKQDESKSKTTQNSNRIIKSDSDSGAVFNLSLEDFNNNFEKLCKDLYNEDIDLSELWDNVVPPQTSVQDNSGKTFVVNTISLLNEGIIISVTTIDGYVSSASCIPDDSALKNNYNMWLIYSYLTVASCSGISIDDFDEIDKMIMNGVQDTNINTLVYDGCAVYYKVVGDLAGYFIDAASEKYVKRMEKEKNINLLRLEDTDTTIDEEKQSSKVAEKENNNIKPTSSQLDKALSDTNYTYNDFLSIKVGKLVNDCVIDYRIVYYSVDEAINAGIIMGTGTLDNSMLGDNTYIACVSGGVTPNIDLPYYTIDTPKALIVILYFDDEANLLDTYIYYDDSYVRAAAIQIMTQGY